MTWTHEQASALRDVQRWFKNRASPSLFLSGYAGTGKTTLARHIAETMGVRVKFAAFTGKAASVLRAKGCPNATTIHSLIYRPVGDSNGRKIKDLEALLDEEGLKPIDERDEAKVTTWSREIAELRAKSRAQFEVKMDAGIKDAELVIIDEASMLDTVMGKDLESFGVPILYLGDLGQLPPVGGKALLANRRPDIMLEEVHRQAKESAIIWAATEVRQGRRVPIGTYNREVIVRPKAQFDWDHALEAEQLICGMNTTRRRLNASLRRRLGKDRLYPVQGDKLICLKNDHEEGLLNGVTCTLTRDSQKRGGVITLDIDYDSDNKVLICDPGHFEENYQKRVSHPRWDTVHHFDYGYAVTGHKSQGSQWRRVIVCDDKMRVEDEAMRRRWLYTVYTRAEEELTVYV